MVAGQVEAAPIGDRPSDLRRDEFVQFGVLARFGRLIQFRDFGVGGVGLCRVGGIRCGAGEWRLCVDGVATRRCVAPEIRWEYGCGVVVCDCGSGVGLLVVDVRVRL
ncbi:hypothetical protein [Nocardia macrotermitis]|uniref:hypothetical protein n=1 Tax=Nocardia macrotermitis TaxID=2585198 RepID=UPI001296764D|nr:hypothetical protein [Nocardia macrotermitis]